MPKNAKKIDTILLIATPSKKIEGVIEKIVTSNLSIELKFFDISLSLTIKPG